VAAVPSGPRKLKGPEAELLAAAWNLTAVPAGVVAVQESAPQRWRAGADGLESFSAEVSSPEAAKPLSM
jgi:hypothetical protein